jgi:GGDEF domain-containing protein
MSYLEIMGCSLVAPALIFALAAALVVAGRLPDSFDIVVDAVPLVVFGGGVLFGLLTRRYRLVLGVVVLALADAAIVNFGGRETAVAVAVLLPLNLAVIAWLGQEIPLAGRGAALFGMAFLQAGVVALLHQPALASLTASLEQPLVEADLKIWTALSQIAVLAFVMALGLALVRFLAGGRQPIAVGAVWALVASFLALDELGSGGPARIHFAAAGLLLIVGASRERRRGSHVDDVTGLPARLELNKALQRLGGRYTLARIEIDDFSGFRETCGADAARRMLRLVATALTKVGGRGRAFYLGEQTFAVVFQRLPQQAATGHLDAVRRVIEASTLEVALPEPKGPGKPTRPGAAKQTVSVTISVGVAESDGIGADPHKVLRAAEHALDRVQQAAPQAVSA